MERLSEEGLALALFLRATTMNAIGCSRYCISYMTPLPQTFVRNFYKYYHQICLNCKSIHPHCSIYLFTPVCADCEHTIIDEIDSNDIRKAEAYNFTVQKLPANYYLVLLEQLNEYYNYHGGPYL